jgi:hypothetical protein
MQTPRGSAVKNWLPDELAWVGFVVTAIVGGIVGYIKAYEQAGVETTMQFKFWGIVRRVVMSGFAGFLLYQLSVEYSLSQAWGYMLSGIVGMFAAEFFEVMWIIVRNKVRLLTGTPETVKVREDDRQ